MKKSHLIDPNNSTLRIIRSKSGSDIPKLISRIPLREISSVLDVGCDIGENTKLLVGLIPAAQIRGIDKSQERIAYATETFKLDNLIFSCKDFELDLIEGKYDLVCFFTVMHWFKDIFFALERTKEVLNKNGFVAIVSVTKGLLREAIEEIRASCKWKEFFVNYKPQKNHVSRDELIKLAEDLGLATVYSNTLTQKVAFNDKISACYSMAKWLEGLERIPLENREEFLLEIVEAYLAKSGRKEVCLEFPSFELILNNK